MNNPTPNEVAAALVAVEIDTRLAERTEGRPLIEAEIGPAEVHMEGEYVTVLRESWIGVCTRAVNAELRAARLSRDLENERELCASVMRVSEAKDAEYEQLRRRYHMVRLIAGLLGVGLVGLMVAVAWRLA